MDASWVGGHSSMELESILVPWRKACHFANSENALFGPEESRMDIVVPFNHHFFQGIFRCSTSEGSWPPNTSSTKDMFWPSQKQTIQALNTKLTSKVIPGSWDFFGQTHTDSPMDWDVFLMFHVYILDFPPTQSQMKLYIVYIYIYTVYGFPTKNGIIRVVTLSGCRVIDLMYIKFLSPKAPVIGCHVG